MLLLRVKKQSKNSIPEENLSKIVNRTVALGGYRLGRDLEIMEGSGFCCSSGVYEGAAPKI